jgi:hypothetical protein
VAFVSFQSRLLLGLRALNHQPIVSADTPVVAGYWHTTPQTQSGKAAPVRFTRDELHWEPWLADKPLAEFSLKNRRSWQNMAIAIRLTSACWRATSRCWSSGR